MTLSPLLLTQFEHLVCITIIPYFSGLGVLKKEYFLSSSGLVNCTSEYYYFVHFYTN